MKIIRTGDKVKLFPANELFQILKMRNFCFDDETRQKVANEIGGKTGTVKSVEEKYQYDYFFFVPDVNESDDSYSIPYQAIDWSKIEMTTIIHD